LNLLIQESGSEDIEELHRKLAIRRVLNLKIPHPQVEVAPTQDMFAVYRGKRDNALDSPAVWRYSVKDALRSPSVPAVDVFRNLINEAEKQQSATP
jgi:hypothetical protein